MESHESSKVKVREKDMQATAILTGLGHGLLSVYIIQHRNFTVRISCRGVSGSVWRIQWRLWMKNFLFSLQRKDATAHIKSAALTKQCTAPPPSTAVWQSCFCVQITTEKSHLYLHKCSWMHFNQNLNLVQNLNHKKDHWNALFLRMYTGNMGENVEI